jgi:hypothetical protein
MARKITDDADSAPPPAAIGHNRPSHDDIRMAVNEMVQWNVKRAELNAAISGFRKGLKAKGITLGVLDEKVRMLEWTPEEIKEHFAERDWYAEAMRYPIGAQLELYGDSSTPDPVKEQLRWRNIGFKDGLAGKGWPDQVPDGCPTECAAAYGEGHEEGQANVRRAFTARQQKGGVPTAETIKEKELEPA